MGKPKRKFSLSTDPGIDQNLILRRYVDLPKYLALLRSRAIYLQRVDLFPDKLEGVLPPAIRGAIDDAFRTKQSPYSADEFSAKVRSGIYLNCWSAGADDNMALWQLYGSASTGVVITTTFSKLVDAAIGWAKSDSIEIFKVQYIDHHAP